MAYISFCFSDSSEGEVKQEGQHNGVYGRAPLNPATDTEP